MTPADDNWKQKLTPEQYRILRDKGTEAPFTGDFLHHQAKGIYTFVSHLIWTPAIILGYFGSIAVHFLINGRYF